MERKKFIIDPEYGVDSRYKTAVERERDAIALLQARLDRLENLAQEHINRAEQLQSALKSGDVAQLVVGKYYVTHEVNGGVVKEAFETLSSARKFATQRAREGKFIKLENIKGITLPL